MPTADRATFEFHFQETFRGEGVELVAGGEVRARLAPATSFATGLAHIETLELEDGEEVEIRIPDLNLGAALRVDRSTPFVVATLVDGELTVRSTASRPGYL